MIFLAGGTGHLGTAVVDVLGARDIPIRVLSRHPSRAAARFAKGVEVVPGDVRVTSSLRGALTDVETVVSAITGFGPGGNGPRVVDLQGNLNLIAAAEAAGVGHFILVSIHGASANHPMELYRAKFKAEERLRGSKLAWTIIRPTVFMELWAGIVGSSLLKSGVATIFGRGENPINFVSIGDVARFVEVAATDNRLRGRVLDVGGPENLTLSRLVEILAEGNGRAAKVRHIPVTALRLGATLLRPIRPDLSGLIQAAVLMDTADMTFDPAELHALCPEVQLTFASDAVGRTPSYSFRMG